ncbi:hypothetical protein [Kitasatospora sp. NPDC088346]|uniref:hypothetical protein n=1 Tax=Kitasatospora sp. NPDC088346 TaxID=3364073 RepID=UPI0038019344
MTLTALAAPAHAGPVTAAPKTAPTAALTADQASAKARATGQAVPVDAATTATDQLTANPDGTLTLNQALAPVRKRKDGTWKPLDATLAKRADGSIAPALTTSDLTLSKGGNGPLAVMKSGTRSLSITLPDALTKTLPAPVLDGPTATYSVLSGVDLKVTADAQGGFSEVLVVKDATAAANPALRSLAFTTKTAGVGLTADPAGNIAAKDPHGKVVFSAPAPVRGVWDSSFDTTAPTVTDPTTGATLDARSGSPARSSAAAPGATARTAPLTAAVNASSITLTPDPALLTGQNTVWPLYIDPTYSSAGSPLYDWTYVNSAFPTTSYWHTSDATGLRVGYNGWESPNYVGRAYARMGVPSSIYGAQVTTSRFYATETWSPSCTATPVELWWTGGISSATTWNNQPNWTGRSDTQTVAKGYSSGCPTASVGFDTTSLMQSAANGSWGDVTLGLKASDESDKYAWKKFQPSTMYMSTTYNHTPNTPAPLTTSPQTSCGGTPTVIGNGDVTLYAGVSDPDGGTLGVAFTAVKTSTGAVVASSTTTTLYATSGTTASLLIPRATLAAAAGSSPTDFSWNVLASDGIANSPTSATCTFTFDPTVPGAPSISQPGSSYTVGAAATFTVTANPTGTAPSSYLYQLNGAAPATVAASSGKATVTIKPTRRVNTLTVTAVSAGGNIGDSANIVLNATAPATAAENDLTGDAHPDLAVVGNRAGLPAGLWLSSGTTVNTLNSAADNIGAQGTAISTNGSPTDWNGLQAVVGHFASGDGFNDVLAYSPATGTGTVLFGSGDGSTLSPASGAAVKVIDKAFTTGSGSKATRIANAGSLYNTLNDEPVNGFPALMLVLDGSLQVEQAAVAPGAFAGTAGAIPITDTNPTGTGNWTGWTITTTLINGLPALFARNDTSGQLYYYSPQNLLDLPMGNPATPLQLAATGWDATTKPVLQAADIDRNGTPDLWAVDAGGKASPYLFNGTTLSSTANQTLVTPTHTWALNDSTANGTAVTTAKDTTGTTPLTGQAGATWSTKDIFNPDVRLNGTSTGVMSSTAALSPSADFTASAWVKADATGGVLLSQDGTQSAGFIVYADSASKQWYFCMSQTDNSAWAYDCVHAGAGGGLVQIGTWTHLTVSYNRTSNVMALYLNGIETVAGLHSPVAGFTGGFRVGDYLYQGSHISPFKGAVSNVQTWAGTTLNPSQVALLSGTPGYVLFPSDDTNYGSGSAWTTARATMGFNSGLLTITEAAGGTWSQGSSGYPNAVLTLQGDGNLGIYQQPAHIAGTGLWSVGMASPGDTMFLQPDGNLVIYRYDGWPIWASGTVN